MVTIRSGLGALGFAATLVLASACGDDAASNDATPGTGGVATGGSSGSGATGGTGDTGGTGASGGSGGTPDGGVPSLADLVQNGTPTLEQRARPDYGALLAVNDGDRVYVVESRRDVEPGPFGIPWRSRFRVAAYDAGVEAWQFEAPPDDIIGDVAIHPSGEITVSVEHFTAAEHAYDLVRLGKDGGLIGTTTLLSPTTIPVTDYGPDEVQPLFRMKSQFADATVAGWVRLVPDGENLVVAFLSFVAVPPTDPLANRLALGIEALTWESTGYEEKWAHVVEGVHAAQPGVWAYDELRQRDQAIRPFLTRESTSGDWLVARAWNKHRCQANVATFAEFSNDECFFNAVDIGENERLPLAVTRYDSSGKRLGTRILRPDADSAEQVPFALAAKGDELAVVGMVVRKLPDESKKTYPGGFIDYDGYVAIYDREGTPLRSHDYNLGHGDVLAAMRWTDTGIVAVGSSGWDRWSGGMSISRGASPLFAWFSNDGADTRERVLPMGDGSRHFNLHDVLVRDGAIEGFGFADAPMTHSADGGKTAQKTFGFLKARLAP